MIGNLIGRLIGSAIGVGAAVVAGAYAIGKLANDEEVKKETLEEEEEDIEVIRLHPEQHIEEPRKEEEVEIESIQVTPNVTKEVVEEKPETKNLFDENEEVKKTVTETSPYPHLRDNKIASIKKQIKVMLENAPDADFISLNHYVVFTDVAKAEAYREKAALQGFKVSNEEKKPNELHLEKDAVRNEKALEDLILSLANDAAGEGGSYKGWAVKVSE